MIIRFFFGRLWDFFLFRVFGRCAGNTKNCIRQCSVDRAIHEKKAITENRISTRLKIDKSKGKSPNNNKMSVEEEVLRIHKKMTKMTSSGTVNVRGKFHKLQKLNFSAAFRKHFWYKKNVVLISGQSSTSFGLVESIAEPENRPWNTDQHKVSFGFLIFHSLFAGFLRNFFLFSQNRNGSKWT